MTPERKMLEKQLDEAWHNIRPYLKQQREIREMCQKCEAYCGKEHDYSECLNQKCFRFYLAYHYLQWSNSYELYPEAMGK